MCQMFLFSLVRNVRKTTNPKIWAGVLEEIPLQKGSQFQGKKIMSTKQKLHCPKTKH